jgi:hypothetical protein
MASIKPSFITGANAKIKVDNITMAYAQDVSYSVTVATIPIETMGRYEVVSNEPVAYFVEGTLSVIRYSSVAGGANDANNVNVYGAASDGNGIGKWNPTGKKDFDGNDVNDKSHHFNPGKLLASQTWDMEVYQKYWGDEIPASGDDPAVPAAVRTHLVAKLKDCRLISKTGSITKRGVLVEQFQFNAILAEDDSFEVSGSGDGDLE